MTMVIPILFLACGLAIFLLALPLAYRKVPMNALYGIRIERAYKSEQSWYDINAYGGRQLARWSWLVVAAGVVGFFLPPEFLHLYSFVGTGVVLVATIAPLIQILIWSGHRGH